MLRRSSSVLRSGSQVQLPGWEIMDAMVKQRQEEMERDMKRVHTSFGAHFAAAAGKARRQSIAADRFESEYVQVLHDSIYEKTGYVVGSAHKKMERLRGNLIGHALMKRKKRQPLTLFFATTEPDGNYFLSIQNDDGSVWLEQPGKKPLRQLAPSLAEFIAGLTPELIPDQE